ncbi:MAG: TetR/AcrR family transcriptional regulator [archaeon]|nr:TetR/AcrR family transcriptional regulator [archaeon]
MEKKKDPIRKPIQKRSIEKKKKIIDTTFKLIEEKGYYSVSTPEIAKVAGVSTGIIYSYFEDKHDILIAGVKDYMEQLFSTILDIPDDTKITPKELPERFDKIMKKFINSHKHLKQAHSKIMELVYSDPKVDEIYKELEMKLSDKIVSLLLKNGFNRTNINERVHVSIGLVNSLLYENTYHKHEKLNYTRMFDYTTELILTLFKA